MYISDIIIVNWKMTSSWFH